MKLYMRTDLSVMSCFSLISLVVHLLMRTEDGAYTVMEFLFETASPSNSTGIPAGVTGVTKLLFLG